MNNDPLNALQENRSFQTLGFSKQIKQAATLIEFLVLLTYVSVLVLSLPLFFVPF